MRPETIQKWHNYLQARTEEAGESIGVINVTNLWSEVNRIADMPLHIYAITEAAIPASKHHLIKNMLAKKRASGRAHRYGP